MKPTAGTEAISV